MASILSRGRGSSSLHVHIDRLMAHLVGFLLALGLVIIFAFVMMMELEPRLTPLFRGLCGCAAGAGMAQLQLVALHLLRIRRPIHHPNPANDTIKMHRRRFGQHLRWFAASLALAAMLFIAFPQAFEVLGLVVGFGLTHLYAADFHQEKAARKSRR